MKYLTKIPYFPDASISLIRTKMLNALVTHEKIGSEPFLRVKPEPLQSMYRIDALKPLESIFGKRLQTTRSEVINWFTMTDHTVDSWNKTLKEFYKDIPEFKLYVDKVLLFSNEETPVQDCLLLPIHLAVNIELTRISEFLEEQPSLKWLYDTKGESVDFYYYYGVRVGKYDPVVPEDFKLEELPLV